MKPLISLTNDFTTEFLISPISSLIRKARFGACALTARTQSGVLAGGGRNHRETIRSREARRQEPSQGEGISALCRPVDGPFAWDRRRWGGRIFHPVEQGASHPS